MEYYFDINWEAGKFYKVACFIILYSDTKHSMLTFSRRSESGGSAKKSKQEKKQTKQQWGGSPVLHFGPLFLSTIWRGYTHGGHVFCLRELSIGSCDNVTQKMNSRCFKLHRTYSTSFNSTNVGEFFWSWIQKTDCSEQWGKEKESPCAVFTVP